MLKEGIILGERYEIISRIGSGGMADVYKAQDHKLNRLVAVKVMKAEFREDTAFVAKFQKEAQAAAKLSHPNIVNVYDVGEDRGMYYIVMELIEGITLKNYITKKGKLSVKEATSIAIQVSLGLEAAHRQGIVHRDVKPQNIIISTDGKVKLSDFGIAKAMNSNTITANVMGSVHYSSPEQVRGGQSDARSDIYSLGITMYEMVTGRVPFDGDSTVSIAIKHLQEEIVPPSRFTPDLPYSLEQIILKCTQKDPDRRYQNVGELVEDLKRSLIDPQGSFVVISPLSSHAQTMQLSDSELSQIRGGERDEERGEDDYDDEDDDYEDEDEDSGKTSGLEKAITIGGFLIGAIIIIILIVVIGNMAGLFHFGSQGTDSTSSAISSSSTASSSSSSEQVEVPDLLGMTLEEAQNTANAIGLGVNQSATAASSEYEEGQICSQEIEAGTLVDPHTQINVTVSTGDPDVTVPTGLVGLTQTEAENKIQDAGLTPDSQKAYSDTVEIGEVISVSPAEGTSVASGSTVTLYISQGPDESADLTVPDDLIGKSEEDAKEELDEAGLSYTTITGSDASYDDGVVIAVSPDPGTAVSSDTTVTLTINTLTDSSESTTSSGKYVCRSKLSRPDAYNGGSVKLELVQGDLTTTIYEGDDPWTSGDYSTPIYSSSGEEGVINVYEDGTLIARYTGVTFEAVS